MGIYWVKLTYKLNMKKLNKGEKIMKLSNKLLLFLFFYLSSNLAFALTQINSTSATNSGDYNNTGYGWGVLNALQTGNALEGNYNDAFGQQALRNTSTGSYNTATGHKSLYSNTTGSSNIASGYLSMYSNTTGYNNTATGYQSLQANTTGLLQYCSR